MSMPAVHLHIDALALNGFAAHDGARIAASLREHLAVLMRTEGVPAGLRNGGRIPLLSAPAVEWGADADPAMLGRQLATAIYGSLRR